MYSSETSGKDKNMKARNVFALLGLTFAMGAGVFAGVSSKKAEEVGAATTSVKIAGSFNDWSAVNMTLGDDDYYFESALSVGDEFKVVVNDSDWIGANWEGVSFPSTNIEDGGEPDHNFKVKTAATYRIHAAKNIGDYEKKGYGVRVEEIVDPTEVEYKVKIAGGAYTTMPYSKTIVEDDRTVYVFSLTVSPEDGQKVFFQKEGSEIKPGASYVRDDKDNNLFYKLSTEEITVIQGGSGLTLSLYVYDDGFDSFLTGYSPNNQKYYFTNNKDWSGTPKYHVFNDNDDPMAEWPGTEMTFVDYDSNNQARYSFTVDIAKWPNFVIANNDGSDQSVNSRFASYTKDGFYLNERDEEQDYHWTLSVYDYVAVNRIVYVGSSDYELSPSAETPEGALIQYETAVISMSAGDVVEYWANNIKRDASLQAYGLNNGKVESEKNKVLVDATAKVYVKIMSDKSTKIFIGGLTVSANFHLIVNDDHIVELYDWTGEVPEGFEGQRYSESITFHNGDKFKLLDTSGADYLPTPFTAKLDSFSVEGFSKDSNGYFVYSGANKDARVFLKLQSGNDEVYIGDVDPDYAAAKAYAIAFNNAIEAVCKEDHSTDKTELETAWGTQATNFKALSESVQNKVKEGSESSIAEIRDFTAKYDSVYRIRKLGDGWNLENFLNTDFGKGLIRTEGVVDNTNMLLPIIVVITVTSVSSIVVLLVIKKRKHN